MEPDTESAARVNPGASANPHEPGNPHAPPNPDEHVNPDDIEVAAGFEHEQLEGWVAPLDGEAEIRDALEKAFDYRGDVTLTRGDGSKIVGYLFDRFSAPSLEESFVRLIPPNDRRKIRVSYADIRALEFTGKDTAAGKSFESWVSKYWAKKAAGERDIQIEPEALD